MPAKKLTPAVVKRLSATDSRQDIRDALTPGLYLRIFPTGRKVWRFRYKWRGKPSVMRLGEWPGVDVGAARQAVLDARQRLDDDLDPAGDIQRARAEARKMPSVADFIDEYIERHAKPNKVSWETDRRVLNREVRPELGKLRLDEVHRRDIVRVLDKIRDRGAHTMANRTYAYIRKMFSFAVERGVLELSPAQHIRTTKEKARAVVLDDDAIRHLWKATEPYAVSETGLPMHHATRLALRLLLLTGQRSGEVCGMNVREVDFDNARWTLPASRTKNGIDHTVPLSGMAMEVIGEALEIAEEGYLFPSNSKAGHLTVYANVQAMERLFDGWEPRYRTHDLRRTVGTRLSELGFNRLIIDKVLNHKDRSVGGIYDRHSYDSEKLAAMDAWAKEMGRILRNKGKRKVIPMQSTGS